MQQLALYTKEAMPDMAHEMEMLTYAEYAYATTSVQLKSLSEGEKVVVIPNTFKEAMGLPEAALWKAASDKEMDSLMQHHVLRPCALNIYPRRAESSRLAVGL